MKTEVSPDLEKEQVAKLSVWWPRGPEHRTVYGVLLLAPGSSFLLSLLPVSQSAQPHRLSSSSLPQLVPGNELVSFQEEAPFVPISLDGRRQRAHFRSSPKGEQDGSCRKMFSDFLQGRAPACHQERKWQRRQPEATLPEGAYLGHWPAMFQLLSDFLLKNDHLS